jgi:hypothetical protein
MALISLILGFNRERSLRRYSGGFKDADHFVYDQGNALGIRCANKNCIVHDPAEGKYASNRFHVIDGQDQRLRCFYCETDIETFVVANKKSKHYASEAGELRAAIAKHEREIVLFSNPSDAEAAGYSLSKRRRKAAGA